MKTFLSFLLFLLAIPSFPQRTPPDLVIVASLLPTGEDVGIAFSGIVPKERVESYIQKLAQLGGRKVENLKIREEEGKTSAHFLLTGGALWKDDKPYIQLFINSFPDVNSLFIALFPFRKIENTLPLHFENEDVIIRNLGVNSFNYEVVRKRKMASPTSLYSTWEKWRFSFIPLAVVFSLVAAIFLLGRRKGRQ